MYLENCWYVAAYSHELGKGQALGRTLLNRPVVLFRLSDGTATALEDRCCHRQLPLSCGQVTGDRIRCGYHGLEFDASGACVAIPGQSRIPPDASVPSWPVVERHGFLWLWPGEKALADTSLIPDWWWSSHPDWAFNPGALLHIDCHYQLIVDNLLDLSHLGYVHANSLGNSAIVDFPVRTEKDGSIVRMTRWIMDRPPPPLYRKIGDFQGNVDRWQIVETIPPGHTTIFAGCGPSGSGDSRNWETYGNAFHLRVLNAPTPETGTSSWYFYGHAWTPGNGDPALKQQMYDDFLQIFHEDVAILEAQQRSMTRDPERPLVDISVDAPGLAARRALAKHISAENIRRCQASTATETDPAIAVAHR